MVNNYEKYINENKINLSNVELAKQFLINFVFDDDIIKEYCGIVTGVVELIISRYNSKRLKVLNSEESV